MHRVVGKGIAWLGGLILLSAVAVNPWIGIYYQDHIENYADVMLNYVWWSLGLAGLLVGVGLMAAKRKSEGWTGAAMAAVGPCQAPTTYSGRGERHTASPSTSLMRGRSPT